MDQGILRTYDLNPDGVRVVVSWEKMVVNASIFIPCVNTEEALSQVQQITAGKGWGVEAKILIEDEKLGLRVWRTT
jgi:hypothetical protein|tara:strand:+ start:4944 stop:5171 length:228 start_codon:yes stop_codon:yes gene_type:complete